MRCGCRRRRRGSGCPARDLGAPCDVLRRCRRRRRRAASTRDGAGHAVAVAAGRARRRRRRATTTARATARATTRDATARATTATATWRRGSPCRRGVVVRLPGGRRPPRPHRRAGRARPDAEARDDAEARCGGAGRVTRRRRRRQQRRRRRAMRRRGPRDDNDDCVGIDARRAARAATTSGALRPATTARRGRDVRRNAARPRPASTLPGAASACVTFDGTGEHDRDEDVRAARAWRTDDGVDGAPARYANGVCGVTGGRTERAAACSRWRAPPPRCCVVGDGRS